MLNSRSRQLALLTFALACAHTASAEWRLTDLGIGTASSINDLGQVVGAGSRDGYSDSLTAFLWSNGSSRAITTTGSASGINNSGQVVGYGPEGPFLWSEAGGLRKLGTPSMDFYYAPSDINDNGQIAGSYHFPGDFKPVIWNAAIPSNLPVPLSLPAGGAESGSVRRISNAGSIAGGAEGYGFVWSGTSYLQLEPDSAAWDINDRGQIAGAIRIGGSLRAALWTGGKSTLLPAASPPVGHERAVALNEKAEVVGYMHRTPVLWKDGTAVALISLLPPNSGWDLTDVCDINERGQIVGAGIYLGTKHAFVLTPINERPTVKELVPVALECVDGQHLVTLSTQIADADGNPLSVTWKVNGAVKKTEANLSPGSTVSFGFDYPHGTSQVSLEVTDGNEAATTGTTVTIQDTAAPMVIVAADAVVPTDPGKAFATNVVLTSPTASDASGHEVTLTSDAPSLYPLGTTVVTWTAEDEDGNRATAKQEVTVVDQEKPKIGALPAVQKYCDPAKLFATVALTKPTATDNVPGAVSVTTAATTAFKIGTTGVVWTATDAAGSVSTSTQQVTVVNRKPKAKAGRDVTVTTTSENGARVTLNGSGSSDPDKHKLKYAWKAKKVKFARGSTPKPSGVFPVGQTTATLTVTDAGGLEHKDNVTVTVKLKNARPRSQGSDANESFAYATQHAGNASASGAGGNAVLTGLAYANAASAYGDAAGEYVRWEEGQSEEDALLAYAKLRTVQATYGEAAAKALLSAYIESGDENLLAAYGYAAYGTAYAAADLNER